MAEKENFGVTEANINIPGDLAQRKEIGYGSDNYKISCLHPLEEAVMSDGLNQLQVVSAMGNMNGLMVDHSSPGS